VGVLIEEIMISKSVFSIRRHDNVRFSQRVLVGHVSNWQGECVVDIGME
jgi:hypothetical protein